MTTVTETERLSGVTVRGHREPGPGPRARIVLALLLGAACGAFAVSVVPRPAGGGPPSP